MSPMRALASAAAVVAVLAFVSAPGCRKPPPAAKAKPLYRIIEEVDVWVDRSPPHRYTLITTEDVNDTVDAAGKREIRMRGDEAVIQAAARRAKAIGADAALMVTKKPEREELSRMTMFVKYTDPAARAGAEAAVAAPAAKPATAAAPAADPATDADPAPDADAAPDAEAAPDAKVEPDADAAPDAESDSEAEP